jgi:putative transposase
MARTPRRFDEGGIYHVYNRFSRGDPIFREDGEVERFLDLLREVRQSDGFAVLAMCILSNHYDLAVRQGPVPLSRTMRSLQGRFSRSFNIRHRSTGPVWQSRFKAERVGDNDYLQRLIVYIHLNPVRAGLVADPARYHWSGHRELLGRTGLRLVDAEDALIVFGESTPAARRRYMGAIRGALAEDGRDESPLTGPVPWAKDSVVEPRQDIASPDMMGRPTGLERPDIEERVFVTLCAQHLKVPLDDLCSRLRGSTLTEARELIVSLALQRWRQRGSRLASVLGLHPESVSRLSSRGRLKAAEVPEFAVRLEDLDRAVTEMVNDEVAS